VISGAFNPLKSQIRIVPCSGANFIAMRKL
jgi:hypothetical protein